MNFMLYVNHNPLPPVNIIFYRIYPFPNICKQILCVFYKKKKNRCTYHEFYVIR
jgi:hypothetical protein